MSLSKNQFKIIKSNGKIKFIISKQEVLFFNDVLYYLNVFSWLKNTLNYFNKALDSNSLGEIKDLSWVPKTMIASSSVLVLGEESNYKKVTMINKSNLEVTKALFFNTECEAQTYKASFEDKLIKHEYMLSRYPKIDIDVESILRIELSGKMLFIVSRFNPNLKKLNVFDLSLLYKNFIAYIQHVSSKEVRHGDFKVYNLRKQPNGRLFLFDLESLEKNIDNSTMVETLLYPYQLNKKISLTSLISLIYLKSKISTYICK